MRFQVAGLLMFSVLLSVAFGCGETRNESVQESKPQDQTTPTTAAQQHNYEGWWCVEHGVPEEECSLCNKRAAERFKAKGDWCQEHHRAASQCFVCNPSRREYYAKLFEAKFGYPPPKPEQ